MNLETVKQRTNIPHRFCLTQSEAFYFFILNQKCWKHCVDQSVWPVGRPALELQRNKFSPIFLNESLTVAANLQGMGRRRKHAPLLASTQIERKCRLRATLPLRPAVDPGWNPSEDSEPRRETHLLLLLLMMLLMFLCRVVGELWLRLTRGQQCQCGGAACCVTAPPCLKSWLKSLKTLHNLRPTMNYCRCFALHCFKLTVMLFGFVACLSLIPRNGLNHT